MTLQDIVDKLQLNQLTESKDYTQLNPTGGYASDLLSCVMAGAPRNGIWVTLQSHINVVAVAALLELNAVIITEGSMPDDSVIEKANEENINVFLTDDDTYTIVGRLWEMGLKTG